MFMVRKSYKVHIKYSENIERIFCLTCSAVVETTVKYLVVSSVHYMK